MYNECNACISKSIELIKDDILCDLPTFMLKLEELEFDPTELYKVGVTKFLGNNIDNLRFLEVSIGIENDKSSQYFSLQVFITDITKPTIKEIHNIINIYDNIEHGLILYNHQEIFTNNIIKKLYEVFQIFCSLNKSNSSKPSLSDKCIFTDIYDEFEKITNSEYSHKYYFHNNNIVVFSILIIKHCRFYKKSKNSSYINFLHTLNLLDKESINKLFNISDFSNLSKISLGYFKVKLDNYIDHYYEISIESNNIPNNITKEIQSRVVLKDITSFYYFEKNEKDLNKKMLSLSITNNNLKIPITVIRYILGEGIFPTRTNKKLWTEKRNTVNINTFSGLKSADVVGIGEKSGISNMQSASAMEFTPVTPSSYKTTKDVSKITNRIQKNYEVNLSNSDSHLTSCLYYYLLKLLEEFSLVNGNIVNDINKLGNVSDSTNKLLNHSLLNNNQETNIFNNYLEAIDFCYIMFHTKLTKDKKGVRVINSFDNNVSSVKINNEFKIIQVIVNLLAISSELLSSGDLFISAKLISEAKAQQVVHSIRVAIKGVGNFVSKDRFELFLKMNEIICKNPNQINIQNTNNYNSFFIRLVNIREIEESLNLNIKVEISADYSLSFSFDIPYEISNDTPDISNINGTKGFSSLSINEGGDFSKKHSFQMQSHEDNDCFKRPSFLSVADSIQESVQVIEDFFKIRGNTLSKFKIGSQTNNNSFLNSAKNLTKLLKPLSNIN